MKNHLKGKLHRGELALGLVHFASGCASTIEVMAGAGIDWVTIDTEHACNDMADLQMLIRAADSSGITPIVRFMQVDRPRIQQVMDAGAGGVMISHVCNADQARAAVAAAKYPPIGQRGACPTIRSANYDPPDWEEYARASNDQIIVNVLVEEREGYEQIEEILAVPGVDVVFLGNFDLSISFGLPGETRWDHPVLAEALKRVVSVAKKNNVFVQVSLGTKATEDPAYAELVANAGVDMLGCGSDLLLLSRACQRVTKMRGRLSEQRGARA